MANRLAVIRGLQRALKQPRAEIVPVRPVLPDDRLERLMQRIGALEQGKPAQVSDAVVVKVVYRGQDGLITHVVERTMTEDEFAEFEQGLKPDGN